MKTIQLIQFSVDADDSFCDTEAETGSSDEEEFSEQSEIESEASTEESDQGNQESSEEEPSAKDTEFVKKVDEEVCFNTPKKRRKVKRKKADRVQASER